MKGLKASLITVLITLVVCIVLFITGGIGPQDILKKADVETSANPVSSSIVVEEGTFPSDIYYEFGEDRDIYYVKYDDRSSVKIYNLASGRSESTLTPLNAGNEIHAFCKSGDYFVWEEDSLSQDSVGGLNMYRNWKIFIRKGNHIVRIDEGRLLEGEKDAALKLLPEKLSVSGNFLVYKTYNLLPGMDNPDLVIKLYDMENDRSNIIYSTGDIKNLEVSEPCIYKNYVVWSTAAAGDTGKFDIGDLYLYNIGTWSLSKLTDRGSLTNPLIWEDYIICNSLEATGPSIVVMNFKTGFRKHIAFSDSSLSPKREIHDYSAGGGYVTWDNSYADTVSVYDIIGDKVYELKKSSPSGNNENSLLNIRLYGKALVFTDHVFNKKNGSTVSEVNRYMILR